MNNSRGGVKQRLKQFLYRIEGDCKNPHSAATRFFKEYANHTAWREFSKSNGGKQFYVTSVAIRCEVKKVKRMAEDLQKMGDVAALEYYVRAHIKEKFGAEPDLNQSSTSGENSMKQHQSFCIVLSAFGSNLVQQRELFAFYESSEGVAIADRRWV